MGTPTRVFFNLTRQVNAPWPALPGRPWRMDLYARPRGRNTPAWILSLLSPRKFDLLIAPFGRLLVDPSKMLPLGPFPVFSATGVHTITLTIPNKPVLLGAPFFLQGLAVPALPSSPFSWRFTNALRDRVEPF